MSARAHLCAGCAGILPHCAGYPAQDKCMILMNKTTSVQGVQGLTAARPHARNARRAHTPAFAHMHDYTRVGVDMPAHPAHPAQMLINKGKTCAGYLARKENTLHRKVFARPCRGCRMKGNDMGIFDWFAGLESLCMTCAHGVFGGLREDFVILESEQDEDYSSAQAIDAPEWLAAGGCASGEDWLGGWRTQQIVRRV